MKIPRNKGFKKPTAKKQPKQYKPFIIIIDYNREKAQQVSRKLKTMVDTRYLFADQRVGYYISNNNGGGVCWGKHSPYTNSPMFTPQHRVITYEEFMDDNFTL